MISALELRKRAATPDRLCDCGRPAVTYKSNSYVCAFCLSQAPASAYLGHGGATCAPETFPVRLASYDPEVTEANAHDQDGPWAGSYMRVATTGVLLALLLSILPSRADYAVEFSTNLTEWAASSAPWDQVLEMARTNPATAGNAAYYYRLSPEAEPSSTTSIPQDLAWNYVTNVFGEVVQWASDQTNLVQLGENLWVIQNPAMVFLVSPISTNVLQSSTLTEWTSYRLAPEPERASDGFHAARQAISPPPPPIKERVTIGDPFFPTQSRRLEWTYDANFTGSFEIWWGNEPANLVQVGETKSRSWQISVPARLGWFGVRARTLSGYVSQWTTVPNLK